MPASPERLRRLEALASDPAASDAERATAERLAARERAELGPAASSSAPRAWSAEELEDYRRRELERLKRWRDAAERDRRERAELLEELRRCAPVERPAVASVRRREWKPVGQWGPGRRW